MAQYESFVDDGSSFNSRRDNSQQLQIAGSNRDVPLVFIDKNKNGFVTQLHNNLLSLKISFTMDEASALSFDIVDPGFEMTKNNLCKKSHCYLLESCALLL